MPATKQRRSVRRKPVKKRTGGSAGRVFVLVILAAAGLTGGYLVRENGGVHHVLNSFHLLSALSAMNRLIKPA